MILSAKQPISLPRMRSNIISQLGWIVFILWFPLEIGSLMPLVEMAIFNGHVPVPTATLKFLLIPLLLVALVLRRSVRMPNDILFAWCALISYLVFDAANLLIRNGLPLEYILFSYNASYIILILLPMFFAVRETISQTTVTWWVIFFSAISIFLSIAQHYLNSPILPTASVDGYYAVMVWEFYGAVRGFGLFTISYLNGFFTILGMSIFIVCTAHARSVRKIWWFWLVCISLVAVYTTLTRAVYFEAVMSLITIYFLMKARPPRRLVSILPLVYGISGFAIAYLTPFAKKFLDLQGSLTADQSLMIRYEEWQKYGNIVYHHFDKLMFGTGLIQNSRFDFTRSIVIDNSYLATIFQNGVIGLMLWMVILWLLWIYALRTAIAYKTPLTIGVASAFSIWPFAAVFNNILSTFVFIGPIMILIMSRVGAP